MFNPFFIITVFFFQKYYSIQRQHQCFYELLFDVGSLFFDLSHQHHNLSDQKIKLNLNSPIKICDDDVNIMIAYT